MPKDRQSRLSKQIRRRKTLEHKRAMARYESLFRASDKLCCMINPVMIIGWQEYSKHICRECEKIFDQLRVELGSSLYQ